MPAYRLPIGAFLIATFITTTMDFSGYSPFSALPLVLITLVFWAILRLSKKEIGLNFTSLWRMTETRGCISIDGMAIGPGGKNPHYKRMKIFLLYNQ